jgi:hypothetical protein
VRRENRRGGRTGEEGEGEEGEGEEGEGEEGGEVGEEREG